MRFGLRARFILVITLVLLGVFTAIAYFVAQNQRLALQRDLNVNSRAFAELATRPIGDVYSTYQAAGSVRVQQEAQKFTALNTTVSNINAVGLDGTPLLSIKGAPATVDSTSASSFEPIFISNKAGIFTRIIEPYLDQFGQHKFAIAYDFSTSELDTAVVRNELIIVMLALGGLLASAYVTYELVNSLFLRPIENVSRMATIVGHGDYTQQIQSDRNDEIGDLARTVNQMADTLKANIQKLQEVDRLKNEFLMITSHNLRTPLTVINGYIDILKTAKLSKDTKEMIGLIERSTTTLATFSEDMLTISSIEAGNTQPMTVLETTVADLIDPLRNNFDAVAGQKKIKLNWKLPSATTPLRLSLWYTRSALGNLLANAIKFTAEGGRVDVNVTVNAEQYIFSVTDTGIGIAPDEMKQLFTKFHRGTSTLQYDYEGTGIGLYASKLLVEAQKGHISVTSEPGKGSTFTITMPAGPKAA